MKRTGPTNTLLQKQIADLRSSNVKLWQRAAYELERATRKRREVNLSKLQRFVKDGETVLVPGKVLSAGTLTKKITVAAWVFSAKSADVIKKAGGSAITIDDLMKKNPKGTGVRLIG